MSNIGAYIAQIAPLYNLFFALIAIAMFAKLAKTKKNKLSGPWAILFVAVILYVFEEILTIMRQQAILQTPRLINQVFELSIMLLVIYFLLVEHYRFTKHSWTIAKKPKKKSALFVWRHMIDHTVYFFSLFSPLITLPQIIKIWIYQETAGISIATWGAYQASAFFWLLYGILHKEKPIIIANILWLTIQAGFIIGSMLYG